MSSAAPPLDAAPGVDFADPALRFEIDRRALSARSAALEAGRLTFDYYTRGVPAELKADLTPVTAADRDAETLIRKRFGERFPGDAFLGEEHGEDPGTTGFRWIIDPIDATLNFVRGIPLFGTLIGLEYRGRTVAGVCYVPGLGDLYHAVRGGGAFKNDRPIRVSTIDSLDRSQIIYTGIERYARIGKLNALVDLATKAHRTRGFGDFYGYLLVAEGAAELFFEPKVSPWDIAALKPIVEEAGGVFTDLEGTDTIYGVGTMLGNPALHAVALERFRRAD
ncbi:MAG: inositol monophosphatase family protein [Planctomycetia bacterium]